MLQPFCLLCRLRLAVPLYGRHLRKWRTELRDWEQNKQTKWAEVSWSMHICVQSAQQRFWLVRFKVQRETRSSRRAVYHTSPRHALYCAGWISTHCSVIPLMFIYVHTFRTVCLSVLVFEHPRGGRVKIRGLLMNQSKTHPPIIIQVKTPSSILKYRWENLSYIDIEWLYCLTV